MLCIWSLHVLFISHRLPLAAHVPSHRPKAVRLIYICKFPAAYESVFACMPCNGLTSRLGCTPAFCYMLHGTSLGSPVTLISLNQYFSIPSSGIHSRSTFLLPPRQSTFLELGGSKLSVGSLGLEWENLCGKNVFR